MTGLARRLGQSYMDLGMNVVARLAVGMMQDGFESSRTYIIVRHGLESKRNAIVPISLTSHRHPQLTW